MFVPPETKREPSEAKDELLVHRSHSVCLSFSVKIHVVRWPHGGRRWCVRVTAERPLASHFCSTLASPSRTTSWAKHTFSHDLSTENDKHVLCLSKYRNFACMCVSWCCPLPGYFTIVFYHCVIWLSFFVIIKNVLYFCWRFLFVYYFSWNDSFYQWYFEIIWTLCMRWVFKHLPCCKIFLFQ